MPKSIATYWNPLNEDSKNSWNPAKGPENMAEELTLSIDEGTGIYTIDTVLAGG